MRGTRRADILNQRQIAPDGIDADQDMDTPGEFLGKNAFNRLFQTWPQDGGDHHRRVHRRLQVGVGIGPQKALHSGIATARDYCGIRNNAARRSYFTRPSTSRT